jgi:hypothetical protein
MKCNETQGKWCKNKHGASKIIDTFETYHAASRLLREECSNASYTNGGRHHRLEPHEDNLEQGNQGNHVQNLYSSFLSVDERGNIVPKTPEAALVAAQAYLLTTQPSPGDPRTSTHQASIQGLGLIRDKLQQGKSCGKADRHTGIIAPSGAGKIVDPNLRTTKHNNRPSLDHLSKQTTIHGMEMQGTSSRKHG